MKLTFRAMTYSQVVTSGCGKNTDYSCGINVRHM